LNMSWLLSERERGRMTPAPDAHPTAPARRMLE